MGAASWHRGLLGLRRELGEQGRAATQLRGEGLDRAQRRRADVMLHSFDIVIDHAFLDPEELQEISQELMTPCNAARECFASAGQDESTIFLVFQQAISIESLHHVRDARLRNLQAGGNIDDARVAL